MTMQDVAAWIVSIATVAAGCIAYGELRGRMTAVERDTRDLKDKTNEMQRAMNALGRIEAEIEAINKNIERLFETAVARIGGRKGGDQ